MSGGYILTRKDDQAVFRGGERAMRYERSVYGKEKRAGVDGWTRFHTFARDGMFSEKDACFAVLSLADDNGWTVAHELALNDRFPSKFLSAELLVLADCEGWSVAGTLAPGKLPPEYMIPEVAGLAAHRGAAFKKKCVALQMLEFLARYLGDPEISSSLFPEKTSPRTQAVVDYVSRIPSETLPLLQDAILSVPHSEPGLPDLVELLSSVLELNGIGTTDKFISLLRKMQERRMAEKQQSRKEKSFLGKLFGYQRVENGAKK